MTNCLLNSMFALRFGTKIIRLFSIYVASSFLSLFGLGYSNYFLQKNLNI